MAIQRVERDLSRFRQIVRGKIKKDLRKYMSHGEMIGRQGKHYVSIPLPQIDIPQFRYGAKQGGGVGQQTERDRAGGSPTIGAVSAEPRTRHREQAADKQRRTDHGGVDAG